MNVPMELFLPLLDPQDTEMFWSKGNIDIKAKPIFFLVVQIYRVGFCFPVPHRFSPHTHKVSHKHLDNWIG